MCAQDRNKAKHRNKATQFSYVDISGLFAWLRIKGITEPYATYLRRRMKNVSPSSLNLVTHTVHARTCRVEIYYYSRVLLG